MNITFTGVRTVEEQLDRWDAGNSDEQRLARWLRQHLVDIEDQQSRDCVESYEEGFNDGYAEAERQGKA